MDLILLNKCFYLLLWLQFIRPETTAQQGCLDPGPIANGYRKPPPVDGYLDKYAEIRFICDKNYSLKGARKIFCDSSNHWKPTDTLPECIPDIYCNKADVTNGELSGTTVSGSYDKYVVNSTATLSCDPGYAISQTGESVNYCKPDGTWEKEWATCEEFFFCYEPENVANAHKVFSIEHSQTGYYFEGTTVTYHCKSGYTMYGSNTLQCKNGQWSGDYPKCELPCSSPPTVPHGSYKPLSQMYSSGDQVVYTCEEGYHLPADTGTVTCNHLGNWTGSGQITCVPDHHCLDPGNPENGKRCCQEVFIPGVKISFYCDSGYELVGRMELTCQPMGQWDGYAPSCVQVSTEMPQDGQNMLTNETFTIVVAISGSIMGILTVTVILSIRECCTQRRRRRPHCRYHSSISSRLARMRERRHSHLMSLTSNMEVPLPSYEEAIASNPQTTLAGASAHQTQTAENNDVSPELPPRPAHLTQIQLQTTESQQRPISSSTINLPSPPVPRSSRIPPWRRRRNARNQEQQSVNSAHLENLAELSELSHSTDPLIDVLDETSRNDVESSESGVISDQQEDDGSEISAIAGELTPSDSSESLSTFEGNTGICVEQQS
ncbi:sushi domain-containing protein 4-like [Anneissia japonica]|uniref:sushi domain-containing protein 4-like n=1 Tax=Anneissia japonica TaxID=1529436 RepID=UPI001425579D|nr:sushi domain-containing protein 4-like [Anneissia japonica]XP_033105003.1 sushi domain-containing protein 4-like [Anneissia japonica]XP_033105005.1 sushi domain-containing protein 4-like [Anneissia japonica]XP_033105006.1 sushi domain-containing protein 4-like [Anneissia japonica]